MASLLDGYTPVEKAILRQLTLNSFEQFTRFFHKVMTGERFMVSGFHTELFKSIESIVSGDASRHCTSMCPGTGKTHINTIMFAAWGIAKNPRSKFIFSSYSSKLSQLNSNTVRDIVKSEEYQELYGVKVRKDTDSKELWYTEEDGGIYATSMAGAVTGFRAGYMIEAPVAQREFRGAIIIDDPQKINEMRSSLYRETTNENYNKTFMSRLAQEDVPVIVVQQRIHTEDLSGYLLNGGSAEVWNHLMLPAIINNEDSSKYTYSHGKLVEHSLPDGALWESKLSLEDCSRMQNSNQAVWLAQYMQTPSVDGGTVFKEEWFNYYDGFHTLAIEDLVCARIYVDSAMKAKAHNDRSCFQAWVKHKNGNIYLIDGVADRWEAPELEKEFIEFYDRIKALKVKTDRYPWRLECAKVEDKASGTGLIQKVGRMAGYNVVGIPRSKDKYSRACEVTPELAAGKVFLPKGMVISKDIIGEAIAFTSDDSHKHDDTVDPMMDAIQDLLIDEANVNRFAGLNNFF